MPQTQAELIQHATVGFELLLNNRLEESKALFASNPASHYHLLGVGISGFLTAALGQEDGELLASLAVLTEAETVAGTHGAARRPKTEAAPVFPAGTEHKILIADSVIAQALCHILTESSLEFLKAVYKLNRAYKGFGAAYKVVFPGGVAATDSLTSIFTTLNATYIKAKAKNEASPSTTSSLFGWGSKKPQTLRHSSSTSALPSQLSALKVSAAAMDVPATAPTSRSGSRRSSVVPEDSLANLSLVDEDGERVPEPAWAGDALTTLIISGAAFGFGLFGLIFSLLPPKLRKLISWFGFSNSNRTVALKLLTVAASTGDDVHGYFASLCLVTYYQIILLMSGWQAEEAYLLREVSAVLTRVTAKFPDGTLWILNRAKLFRMSNDVESAITTIEGALANGSTFREADSLLVFELSWCYLSDARWTSAAASFIRMREMNSWSHATYVCMAAGALLELPASERTPEITVQMKALLDELPALFGQKRLLGEPPSTEIWIARKLSTYNAKHARWIASERVSADSHYSEVIRISPASELAMFWNTTGRAPARALQSQIDHLSAFSPPPAFSPSNLSTHHGSASKSSLTSATRPILPLTHSSSDDLDSPDEIALRDLLLGTLYRSLGSRELARAFLEAVVHAAGSITEEKWIVPFASLELAVLECQEADAEEATLAPGDKPAIQALWNARSKKAERCIESVYALTEYDLKSRLESRAGMLRDQIGERKLKLGLL